MSSTTGRFFRVTTFGESHGPAVGCVVDGCPPRLPLGVDDIQPDLDRRRPGQSRLTTQRQEADRVEILSGVEGGLTLGTPIALVVANADHRPGAYDHMDHLYRPSHADWTYQAKYGTRARSGGGRASARETVGRVAAAAIARSLLRRVAGVEAIAWVEQIGEWRAGVDPDQVSADAVEGGPTRCPVPEVAARMEEAIDEARRSGDSLGGVVGCVVRGVPAGLGDPVFDKLTADLAKATMSLPASRGFEIGEGFGAATMTGRAHNDPFVPGPDGHPLTATNHSGGIQGGITNGADIVFRVAFKPTATIAAEQQTVDEENRPATLAARGRHDPCVLPRAVPLVEAAALLAVADAWLAQRAVDVLGPNP